MNKSVTQSMNSNVILFMKRSVRTHSHHMVDMGLLLLLHTDKFQDKNAGMFQDSSAEMFQGRYLDNSAEMCLDKSAIMFLKKFVTAFQVRSVTMFKLKCVIMFQGKLLGKSVKMFQHRHAEQ